MWIIFGVVALLVSVLVSAYLRQAAGWSGSAGRSEGRPFQEQLVRRKQGSRWRLGVVATTAPEFQLKPQGVLDGWFHRLGINDEVQTGDHSFDDRIYVASDHPLMRQTLRYKPALREAILALLQTIADDGWTVREIRLAAGRLWITATHRNRTAESPGTHPAVALLEQIRAQLPQATGEHRFDPYFARAALVLALSTGLAISGAIELMGIHVARFPQLVDSAPLWRASLLLAPLLTLAFIVAALWWLKRSARSHYIVIELLTIGLFGIWAWTFTGLREWNMRGDQAASTRVERAVASVYTTTSRSRRSTRTHYHLVFPNVPAHELPGLDLLVDSTTYAGAESACFRFDLRQGALDWRWFERMERLPDSDVDCGQ